jgi:hypothetical protein
MINLCKRETYYAENLYNNSIYEEDKAIIHKMNQQLLCLYLFGRNKICITVRNYIIACDLDNKVILNHKQNDIQNLGQSVDILKSKSYDNTSILLQFESELHILVLPQLMMFDYYKTIGLYKFLTR